MLGGLALGLTPAEVAARYDEVVDLAGIGEFLDLPMRAYSSGMNARLRFAISSVGRPDILMIDEALATGDAEFRERSRERIDEIGGNAGTVLLVSHSMSTIRSMCDRVLWMHQGQLVMDGPVHEVADAYKRFVRAQRPGMGPARRRALQRKRARQEAAAAAEQQKADGEAEAEAESKRAAEARA